MKKILIFILSFFLALAQNLYARQAIFNCEDYSLSMAYNEKACPGDAVFIRMKLNQTSAGTKKAKILKTDVTNTEAEAGLFADGKPNRSSKFFVLSKNSRGTKNSISLLAGIPLSTFLTENTKYSIEIAYTVFGEKKIFSLPFSIDSKSFEEENIIENEETSGDKIDTSVKRMEQIRRMNSILETKSAQSIFQPANFTFPVNSAEKTASFGTRKKFKFASGGISTKVHHGIDFELADDTEIKSCAEGKVVFIDDKIESGWTIVIEHLSGLYSIYSRLGKISVKEGDILKPGQTIAATEKSYANPTFHWEVRLNNEPVNPDFLTECFSTSDEPKQ